MSSIILEGGRGACVEHRFRLAADNLNSAARSADLH